MWASDTCWRDIINRKLEEHDSIVSVTEKIHATHDCTSCDDTWCQDRLRFRNIDVPPHTSTSVPSLHFWRPQTHAVPVARFRDDNDKVHPKRSMIAVITRFTSLRRPIAALSTAQENTSAWTVALVISDCCYSCASYGTTFRLWKLRRLSLYPGEVGPESGHIALYPRHF